MGLFDEWNEDGMLAASLPHHADRETCKSKIARLEVFAVFGFFLLYICYVSVLSLKGVFYVDALPPRVMVFTTLPLAVILFAFVGNTALFKKLFDAISLVFGLVVEVSLHHGVSDC